MKFSEFAKILYGVFGGQHKQGEFVEELFRNIVDNENFDPLNNIDSSSTLNRYFNGKTSIRNIAKKIIDKIDITIFMNYIDNKVKSDDQIQILKDSFKHYGIEIRDDCYSEDIANLFRDIIGKSLIKNSSLKEDKEKNVIIQNNYVVKGALVPEEIIDLPIEEINNSPMDEFNQKEKIVESIIKNKLPSTIIEDFEPKIEKVDDKYKYVLHPKNSKALEKHKVSVNYTFSSNDAIGARGLRALINEANRTNSFVKVGNPLTKTETIDGLRNPLPMFEDNIEGSVLYIGPETNPRTINLDLLLYNDYFSFKINNFKVQLLEVEENVQKYSNKRFENDWFNFELNFIFNDEEQSYTIRYTLSFKEEYFNDVNYYKNIFKYLILSRDLKSKTRLSTYDNERKYYLINSNDYGTLNLTKQDYDDIINEINYMDRLIQFENVKDIKFDFNYEEFHRNLFLVDLLYNNGDLEINKNSYWSFEVPISDSEHFSIGKIMSFSSEIFYVEFMGYKEQFSNLMIYIKEGKIVSKDINDNIAKIKVNAAKVIIKHQ